jgi:hypothetical protein
MKVSINGFRRLVRAAKIAFKSDHNALQLAKSQLKQEFILNKNVTDEINLQQLYKGIDEAEEILTFQIVQAAKNSRGNYGIF